MVEPGVLTCRTIDARTSSLSNILHAYSALVPPRQISIPPFLAFSEVQGFFLNSILLNEHFKRYPPSQKYQRKFWKWALERLEVLSQNEEVRYDIWSIILPLADAYAGQWDRWAHLPTLSVTYSTRMVWPKCAKSFSYVTFIPSEDSLPSDSYITYYWKSPVMHGSDESQLYETVTLLESQTTVAASTTGLRTWRASLALAQYLIEHAGWF